jgi:hypothetical protein
MLMDGRQAARLFPRYSTDGTSWLYAVGFADGKTKIGMTRMPCRRIVQHWIASDD